MAQPKSLTAFWVRFDLIKISDGSIFTVRFGDFDWSQEDTNPLWSSVGEIFGGLLDVSGCAYEVGEPLPVKNGGSITIDITRGAYKNRNLRASDLLKDYHWINSKVYVNSWKGKPEETGSSADVRIEFVGQVKDLEINPQSNQMKVTIEPIPFNTVFEQKIIEPSNYDEGYDGELTVTEYFGKYLPICFGAPTVPTYLTYADIETADYSVATYPTGFSMGDWITIWTPNNRGAYVQITDEGLFAPEIGDQSGTTTGRTLTAPWAGAATPINSRSFRQRFTATKNYLLYFLSINLVNKTGAAQTYNMLGTVRLFKKTRTSDQDIEFEELAVGHDLFDNKVVPNDGTASIGVILDRLVPLEIGKRYFIEVSLAGNENQIADYSIDLFTRVETGSNLYRKLGNSAEFERVQKDRAINFKGRCLRLDNQNSSLGGIKMIHLSPPILPATIEPEESKYEDLKLVTKINGLKDDGSGTITGTASAPINDPYEITRFLLRDQLSLLDTTTFNAATILRTTYPRTMSGYSKGRESNEQILSEVLKESACKLVPRNDGLTTKAWALYPYGYQTSSIRYLSEQDVKLISIKQFGRESVVNKVDLAYGESAIPQDTSALQSGQPQRFTKFKVLENGTGGNWDTWTAESFARFGTRPNNNSWTQLSWVEDDKTAEFFAQYLIQSYARPKMMVELELPFFESDYRTIQCMDVIELSHPDMPATFGTSPDSLTPPPVYSGAIVETANYGFPLRQAQSYRLQVYGRQVIFNIGGTRAAALRLSCKVLTNPYEIY